MNINRTMSTLRATLMITVAGAAGLWAAGMAPAAAETLFKQTNLVSDGSVPAKIIDTNLVNPWGIAKSGAFPFWLSDNGTGVATVYSVTGVDNVTKLGLTVTVPPASGAGSSAPTGQVFNGTSGFMLSDGSKASFLFDSEDGAISGWNPGAGTNGLIAVNNSPQAVYKGLAIDNTGGSLYAADFRGGDVEMYTNGAFGTPVKFTDTTLPSDYAPFDVSVLGGMLYVTFAQQDAAKHDDVSGPGHGYVDVFNLDGSSGKRLVSQGDLNSPWGLEIAPSSFGTFAGDLLVGNFGDGTIQAYNAATGAFVDFLRGTDGKPLSITDLWALSLGNGGNGGSSGAVYFTAGLMDEGHGLFGVLTAVPEPSTWAMLLAGFAGIGLAGYRKAKGGRTRLPAAR